MSKPPLGLLQRIKTTIQKHNAEALKSLVERMAPFDVAWCCGRLPVEDRLRVLMAVTPDVGAAVFQEMPLQQQKEMLELGRLPALVNIVQRMDSDEMADLLGALDPVDKHAWMATLPTQELKEAESLLAYPADTAGGLMAIEFVSVPVHLTAGEVASRLQALASSYEHLKVTYVYVLDGQGRLAGVLPVRDLVLKPRETPIESFMIRNVATVHATATQRDVAEIFTQRNLLALPVVNDENKLLGIITYDDVLDVIQDIASDEMLKLSGVSTDESRDSSLAAIVRRRLPWLSLNILLNLMAASVIAFYEKTLAAVISLAFFLPIVSDMSGCSGMQSVAVSVRDLALKKILPRDYFRVLRKEVLVGLVNGFVLGSIIAFVAYLLRGNPALGGVVGLASWLNSIVALCIGGIIPLLLQHWKFDPAVASGPILTTVTDMMGFFLLLSLATVWLPHLTK